MDEELEHIISNPEVYKMHDEYIASFKEFTKMVDDNTDDCDKFFADDIPTPQWDKVSEALKQYINLLIKHGR